MGPLRHVRPFAWVLACALAACGPAPEVKTASKPPSCGGTRLHACERDLGKAVAAGNVRAAEVAAYIEGRAAQDSADPWAKLWADLLQRGGAQAVVVDSRAGSPAAAAEGARVLATAKLPEPGELLSTDLLLAMSDAAGYDHAVWIGAGADGKRGYELYPHDALGPLLLGLRSVARDDEAASHLAENLQLAATLRRAFAAASGFHYVVAAREGANLSAQIEGRQRFEEPVLRARYAVSMLAAAGLSLEPPLALFASAPAAAPAAKPVTPAPSDADTPYGDLLRVLLADDMAAEWKRRGQRILPLLAEDRRAVVDAFFAPWSACAAPLTPPPFDRASDIGLAGLLPGALAGAKIQAITAPESPSVLPLSAWYQRYEAFAAQVDKAGMAWLEAGTLLRQRGDLAGLSASGTATYKRVSEMGFRHLVALRELLEAEPAKYSSVGELSLAYSPGLLADERLRGALIDLTQASTQSKLGRSQEAGEIASSLIVSALAGLTYPPALQAAHYLALQSAFAAKVKGDLSKKTGWGPAGLFVADAVFRVIADQGPNLAYSAEQISRALSDPSIALPNIAGVVSAAVRYAALAKDKPLAALATPAQSTPERAAAREALRKAIASMGAPGEAPPALADEITTLADGLIATLTIVAHKKPPPAAACAAKTPSSADIEVAHALTKLRQTRQKILQSPKFKGGSGAWAKRARLLVTLLSDAMDFAEPKSSKGKKLTLSAPEVETALSVALAEWEDAGARDAVIGIYLLSRFLVSRDPGAVFQSGGPYLFRALRGIGSFLRGGGAAQGAALLDSLAEMTGKQGGTEDLLGTLLTYSKTFYDKGQPDQGDFFLLGTLLLNSLRHVPPPKEAIALAAAHQSRIEWALLMFAEASSADSSGRPDVAAFAEWARKAAEGQCAAGRVDDIVQVMGAVAQFHDGKRKEAREALDRVLTRADAEGLVVPKLEYKYTEKHDKKVFTLSFGLTYGLGFLEGGNTFQVGLGLSSLSDHSAKLSVAGASPDETAKETARYYVRASALAAAYDFLDGDAAHGAIQARRAVSAIVSGVRLGQRSVVEERKRWAEDSRSLLALDAELAASAGLPFLAGDLWTVVKDSLPADMDDAQVEEVLAHAPFGLVDVKDADAPRERARKALRVVAAPLACTEAKVDTIGYEQTSCPAYSTALSLRIADVLKKLPRFKKAPDDAASCAALSALDVFIDTASRGSYDPDAFTKAVLAFIADGRADEAATLLARQRRDGHCSAALLKASRALGRSPLLLPGARADMLSVAVNCAGADGGSELEKDLLTIDEETRKLPDPTRNLKLLLFVAELALKADKPELLLPLVSVPGFVERFLRLSGNAATGVLILHHAAHLLAGKAFETAESQGEFALVCKSFPSDERRTECSDLEGLRDLSKTAAERKTLAKAALERLLAPVPAPSKQP